MLTYHERNFSFYLSKSILDLATCDTNISSCNGACDGQLMVLSSELRLWCMHVCTHDFQAVSTFNTDDDVCFQVFRGFWLQTFIICCLHLAWELTCPPTAHSPFTSISPEHLFTHCKQQPGDYAFLRFSFQFLWDWTVIVLWVDKGKCSFVFGKECILKHMHHPFIFYFSLQIQKKLYSSSYSQV